MNMYQKVLKKLKVKKMPKNEDGWIRLSDKENKELMSCISGLESSNMEQSGRIKKLEEQNAELKAD